MYRDSLVALRGKAYELLRTALGLHLSAAAIPERKCRVVIVTRNTTSSSASSPRKLSVATEEALRAAYAAVGAEVIICCDFSLMDGRALAGVMGNADICIGIHGAGLANCALGNPGMVLIELQVPTTRTGHLL